MHIALGIFWVHIIRSFSLSSPFRIITDFCTQRYTSTKPSSYFFSPSDLDLHLLLVYILDITRIVLLTSFYMGLWKRRLFFFSLGVFL